MITRVSADLGELAAYGGPSSDRAYRDDLRVVRVPSVTGPSPFGRAAARGFDVNASLSYSVFVTASGKQIGTIIESPPGTTGSSSRTSESLQAPGFQRDQPRHHHDQMQPRQHFDAP